MLRNRYVTLGATFACLGLLGAILSSIGATLPAIQEHFGLGIERTGHVSAIFQLDYALLCFFGGILSDLFGRTRVLTVGVLLYAACTLLLGVLPAFPPNLLLFALAGVAGGLLFIGSNTLVVQLFPERRGAYLNLLHLTFSVASVIAPVATGALLSAGRGWFSVYRLLGAAALPVGLLFLAIRPDRPDAAPERAPGGSRLRELLVRYRQLLRNRRFIRLLAANTATISTQFATIYLMTLFLTNTRGLPKVTAGMVLTAYFVLTGVGRLACSVLITRQPIPRLLTLLLALQSLFLLAAWLTRGPLSLVFFALTGLATSGIMPGLLALASQLLPAEVTGSALGLMAMFGGLGGSALTWLTTWAAGSVGLNLSFLAVVLTMAAALLLFAALHRRFLPAGRREPESPENG